MTTNQTIDGVPRERLEDAARAARIAGYTGLAEELRALLDASPCEFHQSSDECKAYSGQSPCSGAAQPQGVPVAWMNVATGHVTTSAVVVMDWDDEKEKVQSLYAEQPAPVAVVLPERREPKHYWDRFGKLTAIASVAAEEWNACLDELKRLNPSL